MLLLLGISLLVLGLWNLGLSPGSKTPDPLLSSGVRPVLVLYIFANTDPQFLDNLRYFVSEAARDDKYCEFVFVIQQSPGERAEVRQGSGFGDL